MQQSAEGYCGRNRYACGAFGAFEKANALFCVQKCAKQGVFLIYNILSGKPENICINNLGLIS